MAAYIALLRGVNVAGKKLLMDDFKTALEAVGAQNVATYVQSGNAVFTSTNRTPAQLEGDIAAAIASGANVQTTVLVRSKAQMSALVNRNPFADRAENISVLHATLLAAKPSIAKLRDLKVTNAGNDEYRIGDRVVYLHCPNGYGTTKLSNVFWEKKLGVATTTRNWRTITELLARAEEL